MRSCRVLLSEDQINVLKHRCMEDMLDSIRKMDEILRINLKSSNYNLLEDKKYTKAYLEFLTKKTELEYFNRITKDFESY